jgi:hypothetical protein
MNKKFVYQVGNNKEVILWCMANQISRLKILLETKIYFILVIPDTLKLHLSNQYCDMWYTPAARKSPSMTMFNGYDHVSIRSVKLAQQ